MLKARIMKRIIPFILISVLVICSLSTAFAIGRGYWTIKILMHMPRQSLGVETLNGLVYACGGDTNTGVLTKFFEEYNPTTDMWTFRTDMSIERGSLSTAVLNGKFYALGGLVNGHTPPIATNSVEVYNSATNTWSSNLATMLNSRHSFGAVGVNGKIYAVGGITASGIRTSRLEVYDPTTNTWEYKASMPIARSDFGDAVAIGTKIYVAGGADSGRNDLARLDVYDTVNNTWSTLADMPAPRTGHSAFACNGKLYLAGGLYNGTIMSTVFEYNPTTNTWDTCASMINPRCDAGGVGLSNGKTYVAGGHVVDNAMPTNDEFTPVP